MPPMQYEIVSKTKLQRRVKEFQKEVPWMRNNINRLHLDEVNLPDDDSIRNCLELYSIDGQLTLFDIYIVDLIQIFCDSYWLCKLYAIEYLEDIQHILNIVSDEVLELCIAKTSIKYTSFVCFDRVLREILYGNTNISDRTIDEIINNNTLKEDIDKVLKAISNN
jgi:hypothetical protein